MAPKILGKRSQAQSTWLYFGDGFCAEVKQKLPYPNSEGITRIHYKLTPDTDLINEYDIPDSERDQKDGCVIFNVDAVEVDVLLDDPHIRTDFCYRTPDKRKTIAHHKYGDLIYKNKELEKNNQTLRIALDAKDEYVRRIMAKKDFKDEMGNLVREVVMECLAKAGIFGNLKGQK